MNWTPAAQITPFGCLHAFFTYYQAVNKKASPLTTDLQYDF
jgi:hypothetical protein